MQKHIIAEDFCKINSKFGFLEKILHELEIAGENEYEVYVMKIRTDMAIEAKRLWDESMEEKTELPGVVAKQSGHFGIPVDIVEILNEEGANAIGKPVGSYVTVDITRFTRRERESFRNTAEAIARVLHTMMPSARDVLVVGLGNRSITPDAVGPVVLENLVVTRHLSQENIPPFCDLCAVSAVAPGVLGKTGIESAELVQSIVQKVNPDCVIVVDALASCEPERLCHSVQISDTGIVPGSGVANHRNAFTEQTLGVPVFAVGVPTIVDGHTFLAVNGGENHVPPRRDLVLTTRDIDVQICEMGKVIGYGISLALFPQLSFDDIPGFIS